MFIYAGIIEAEIAKAKEDAAVREAYWATLPDDEAARQRAKWAFDQQVIRDQRKHELAIAERSRPRNFWGR